MIEKIRCTKCKHNEFKIEETPNLVWLICSKCNKTFAYEIKRTIE